MKQRTLGSWAVVGLLLWVSQPASAQPAAPAESGTKTAPTTTAAPAAAAPAAKGPSDPLSAEERIRRATVPAPGKDCAPDPQVLENARLDALRERNLDFATATNTTIEQARKIAEQQWTGERTQLDVASKADWSGHWENWLTGQGERVAWRAALNPCRKVAETHGKGIPTTRQPSQDLSADRNRGGEHLGLSAEATRLRPGASLAKEMFSAIVLGSFTKENGDFVRSEWVDAQDTRGASFPQESRELFNFMAGLSSGSGEEATDCSDQGTWRKSEELFSVVRGDLIGGHDGAEVLVASASNVSVACSVNVSIERKGTEIARKLLVFIGPAQQGGIVKETRVGFSPDPYGDELKLHTACVPRFRWW